MLAFWLFSIYLVAEEIKVFNPNNLKLCKNKQKDLKPRFSFPFFYLISKVSSNLNISMILRSPQSLQMKKQEKKIQSHNIDLLSTSL